VAPLSPGRFALQETIAQDTHEKLRYAQALLGHAVPTGAVAEVIDRALDALIAQLKKQKFAATSRPRSSLRSSADPRHIPAHVKRAVLERDGGECTFVGAPGARLPARRGARTCHGVRNHPGRLDGREDQAGTPLLPLEGRRTWCSSVPRGGRVTR